MWTGDETNETEAIDTVTTDMTEARELYMRNMSSSLSVDVCSSDQHKDVTKARQLRDVRDTLRSTRRVIFFNLPKIA